MSSSTYFVLFPHSHSGLGLYYITSRCMLLPHITQFLTDPLPWEKMGLDEKRWFWPGSDVPTANFTGCAFAEAGDESASCCPMSPPKGLTFSVRQNEGGATSRQVCECWGLEWDRSIYQRFDNTWVALGCFYEISTMMDTVRSGQDENMDALHFTSF